MGFKSQKSGKMIKSIRKKPNHPKIIPLSRKFSLLKIASRFAKLSEESNMRRMVSESCVTTSLGTDIASLSITKKKYLLMTTGRYFSSSNQSRSV